MLEKISLNKSSLNVWLIKTYPLQLEQIRNLPENVNEEFLNNLLTENERLKDKNQTARNHLGNIVSTLEHGDLRQINGVDS